MPKRRKIGLMVEIGSPSHELQRILDRQKDNPMDHNRTTPPPLRPGLGALCAPNPPWSAWRAQTGAASGRQGRSREAGPRQRQPLRAEAGPVHRCQQQKDMPPDGLASKAGNHRPHLTLSNSRFGRHETGSAIQRLMSDSCHPVPLVLILS